MDLLEKELPVNGVKGVREVELDKHLARVVVLTSAPLPGHL